MFHPKAERKHLTDCPRKTYNELLSVELGSGFLLTVHWKESFVKLNTFRIAMHIYSIIASKH